MPNGNCLECGTPILQGLTPHYCEECMSKLGLKYDDHVQKRLDELKQEAEEGRKRSIRDMAPRMQVVQGDITRLNVDAIVNAANESLLGGGGVDGAIHRAAGPGLLAECRALGGCPTGQARMTRGHRLAARHVIHTVGPVYQGSGHGAAEQLRSCYGESLRLAADAGLASVAFPCISTGVYGYPKAAACELAVSVVAEWLASHELPREVTFCCYHDEDAELYHDHLRPKHRIDEPPSLEELDKVSRGRNFIDRSIFDELMAEVSRIDGADYQDLATAYGDMSRLVVAWLASTAPERLVAIYNELGWKGRANARQFHLAAKGWLAKYHPGRFPGVGDTDVA